MTEKKIHILLIGPLTNVQANLIGGATISFGYLIDYLNRTDEVFTVVNTKKYPVGIFRVLNPIYLLLKVMAYLVKVDVLFLNSSRGGTKYLAPFLFLLAKIFHKKFIFRPFGGDIKDYTAKYNKIQKWIFKQTVLKADIFFLQTKKLIQYYSKYNANTIQLPTSRDNPSSTLLRGDRPFKKRFIYLGFVNEAKGIDHILEAALELGEAYTLHIYGPIKQEKYKQVFKSGETYQGVLSKEEVLKTLRAYDVLLLPTFYEGEGYPGAIIEAYSLGLPVISTDWKAIPEIIKHQKTGCIIKPKSTNELVSAIRYFDESNYPKCSKNARDYFLDSFYTDSVCGKVIHQIKLLFKKQGTESLQNVVSKNQIK